MGKIDPTLTAFSERHVERLTGLTKRQLRYWHDSGFFRPSSPAAAYGRFYAFRDIVGLRTLAALRNDHKVPLQHLRKVAERLAHLRDELWSGTTLYVVNRKVVFREPGTAKPREVLSGQYVFEALPLRRVRAEARAEAQRLMSRAPGDAGKVARLAGTARKTPVLAGTRIPVAAIKRFSAEGYSAAQIIAEYPGLTEADIEAALSYRDAPAAAA
jgi:uncharacterized protein (DUF433 family)/DNA-binding transcriptional MerR regulator